MTISSCLKTLTTGIKGSKEKQMKVISNLSELQKQKYWKIDQNWGI